MILFFENVVLIRPDKKHFLLAWLAAKNTNAVFLLVVKWYACKSQSTPHPHFS